MKVKDNPKTLRAILNDAENDDLDVLCDYLTDSGKGRIALSKKDCVQLINAKSSQHYGSAERELIEAELRSFGGNTVANFARNFRDLFGVNSGDPGSESVSAVRYDEIVRDVATHLRVAGIPNLSVAELEDGVLKALLVMSFDRITLEERETILKGLAVPNASTLAQTGVAATGAILAAISLTSAASFSLSRSIATAAAQALLGRALLVSAAPLAVRSISVLAGPVGWALTGAWALADMASPAYRVTVPSVVQIAYMRRKQSVALMQS